MAFTFSVEDHLVTRLYSRALVSKDRNAIGYAALVLHTLTVIWHIVWFVVGVTVALWVEILPSVWTTVLDWTVRPLNILAAIFCYATLVLTTAHIVVHRPSFPHSWIKQVLFALYLAVTLTLALYDGDMFDASTRPGGGIETRMCIVTMNVYSTIVGLPLSVIMMVVWLVLVSGVGEVENYIQLPQDV